ncbi:DEAD/DEAH box helicase [Mycolicibacterium sp. jd]|uniref:DEAD/DEAH box helicase n=1 Tax=unclassified Mycolicibacterium TaxID=2636767 RepID=UPI00351ADF78
MVELSVVRGTNDKPAASSALAAALKGLPDLDGVLMIGFPIISAPDGRHPIDAVLISPRHGVVVFDVVEQPDLGDYQDRQDVAATRLQQRLLGYKDLLDRRQLKVDIAAATFAPRIADPQYAKGYPVANAATIGAVLDGITARDDSQELYERTLSAIQNISTVRKSRTPRQIQREGSRGARLEGLEASIAVLDPVQSKAVIETVEGVQRIRGLAGSGKTIVLALKAAYLHAQRPDWRIAVTFNTRSLKEQFRRLITTFSVENGGEEPDWNALRILSSWGASGGGDRDGLYYEFCKTNNVEYQDFRRASREYGRDNAFDGACKTALASVKGAPVQNYDVILIDEAQDLPPSFLRLCRSMLREPRRLVYAYDELQTLTGEGLPPPEVIFGADDRGRPLVPFSGPQDDTTAQRDIVLEECYRNSRPVLVTAHGLGFGVARPRPHPERPGLVQMFDQPSLWSDIGYTLTDGQFVPGSRVRLERTAKTSPLFLETHSPIKDLISFDVFADKQAQDRWVAEQVVENLRNDELRHNDIIVINTDPLTTRDSLGPIRNMLLEYGVSSHLAGVDASADTFFRPDSESVTFTGIFRAKGNEAAMVYIVNAEECQTSTYNLARIRNRLFTAITRSKAWVRVVGVGPRMQQLTDEFERIRDEGFALTFTYPTPGELAHMAIVNRDMSIEGHKHRGQREQSVQELVADLETGRLFPEDLDPELVERLRRAIKPNDEQ